MKVSASARTMGILSAATSAAFLGLSPIMGHLAFAGGFLPVEAVGIRALGAALILGVILAISNRRLLDIYPIGLVGCLLAGWINALGALFYYVAITRIDIGLGALLYSLYPGFVALFLLLDGYAPTRLSLVRLTIAIPAVVLITISGTHTIDLIGVLLMLGSSALYALHLPINQRVLYEVPAPTVTFYTLVASTAVLLPMLLIQNSFGVPHPAGSWMALGGMVLALFLSRLTLFLGVKHLGGLQTALIGLGEMLVTVGLSVTLLGETLSVPQWIGAGLMVLSILLGVGEASSPTRLAPGTGWLAWLQPKSPEALLREALANNPLPAFPRMDDAPANPHRTDPPQQ
jgi:drug/metabolite transporter (DMT)-like permease